MSNRTAEQREYLRPCRMEKERKHVHYGEHDQNLYVILQEFQSGASLDQLVTLMVGDYVVAQSQSLQNQLSLLGAN